MNIITDREEVARELDRLTSYLSAPQDSEGVWDKLFCLCEQAVPILENTIKKKTWYGREYISGMVNDQYRISGYWGMVQQKLILQRLELPNDSRVDFEIYSIFKKLKILSWDYDSEMTRVSGSVCFPKSQGIDLRSFIIGSA